MLIFNEEDLKTMIEVEELLHSKLEETNGIKDEDMYGKEYIYFDENDEEYRLWCKYNWLVEKLCQYKDWCKKWNKINGIEEKGGEE